MHETKERQLPSEGASYEPEPDTVAGFIAGMANKVDELLAGIPLQATSSEGKLAEASPSVPLPNC